MKRNPLGRKSEIVTQEMMDETLIYDLKANKAVCLNKTSSIVWKNCNGETEVSDIARKMSKQLGEPITEEFVWLAVDQLRTEGLLEDDGKIETPFEGLSRREVIRKVGMASMIALPIVSSIVAPQPAQAQSCSAPANLPGGFTSCLADAAACMSFSCRCLPGNGATFAPTHPSCPGLGICTCNP